VLIHNFVSHLPKANSQAERLLQVHLQSYRQLWDLCVIGLPQAIPRIRQRLQHVNTYITPGRNERLTCKYVGFGMRFIVSKKAQLIAPSLIPPILASALV